MRLWVSLAGAALLVSGCGGNTLEQKASPLHGNWLCAATSSNAEGLTVQVEYTHRINSHTQKSATETQMRVIKANDSEPQEVVLLFNSAENISINDSNITYTPYSVNLISIERDDLNMLGTEASKQNFLGAVRSQATARYHFEADKLYLYFPTSDMTSVCEPTESRSYY